MISSSFRSHTSAHIISHQLTSAHITSHHLTSSHITLHQLTSAQSIMSSENYEPPKHLLPALFYESNPVQIETITTTNVKTALHINSNNSTTNNNSASTQRKLPRSSSASPLTSMNNNKPQRNERVTTTAQPMQRKQQLLSLQPSDVLKAQGWKHTLGVLLEHKEQRARWSD